MKIKIWKAQELLNKRVSYLDDEMMNLLAFNEENTRKMYEYRAKRDIINSYCICIEDGDIEYIQTLIWLVENDYDRIKTLSLNLESNTRELNLFDNIALIQYKAQLEELANLLQRLEDDVN